MHLPKNLIFSRLMKYAIWKLISMADDQMKSNGKIAISFVVAFTNWFLYFFFPLFFRKHQWSEYKKGNRVWGGKYWKRIWFSQSSVFAWSDHKIGKWIQNRPFYRSVLVKVRFFRAPLINRTDNNNIDEYW